MSRRRGLVFAELLAQRANDPSGANRLPTHHLAFADGERLFWSEADAIAFAQARELSIETVGEAAADPSRRAMLRELHENRELERLFETLAKQRISIDDFALVQEESVSG